MYYQNSTIILEVLRIICPLLLIASNQKYDKNRIEYYKNNFSCIGSHCGWYDDMCKVKLPKEPKKEKKAKKKKKSK